VYLASKLRKAGATRFDLGDFSVDFLAPEDGGPAELPPAKTGMVTFADIESGKYFE
jgi:hypothetical protein